MRDLMPHQEEGKVFAHSRNHFGLFFEMRLGKTLTYIRYIQETPEVKSILVIAPSTVLTAWEGELLLENEDFILAYQEKGREARYRAAVHGLPRWYKGPGKRCWVLMHPAALRSLPELLQQPWDAIVLDESTFVKNPTAQITKLLLHWCRDAKHRTILTGQPAPENILDIYSQMKFLHGSFMGCKDFWQFRAKFFEQLPWNEHDWRPKKGLRDEILNAAHEKCMVKRRIDVNMGGRKVYSTRRVELPQDARRLYKKVEKEFASDKSETQWQVVVETWLARIAGGFTPEGELLHEAKVNEILDLLAGELRGESVVISFRFNDELNLMHKRLLEAGIRSVRLAGDVEVQDRRGVISGFQNKKDQVVCVQGKIGRFGLDLSASDTLIFYSNWWGLEDRSQMEDRIIHPMKTAPSLVLDIAAADTVDEDVIQALGDKNVDATLFMMNVRKHYLNRTKR